MYPTEAVSSEYYAVQKLPGVFSLFSYFSALFRFSYMLFTYPWNDHKNQDNEHINAPESFLMPFWRSSLPSLPSIPAPREPLICFLSLLLVYIF